MPPIFVLFCFVFLPNPRSPTQDHSETRPTLAFSTRPPPPKKKTKEHFCSISRGNNIAACVRFAQDKVERGRTQSRRAEEFKARATWLLAAAIWWWKPLKWDWLRTDGRVQFVLSPLNTLPPRAPQKTTQCLTNKSGSWKRPGWRVGGVAKCFQCMSSRPPMYQETCEWISRSIYMGGVDFILSTNASRHNTVTNDTQTILGGGLAFKQFDT